MRSTPSVPTYTIDFPIDGLSARAVEVAEAGEAVAAASFSTPAVIVTGT